MVAANVWHELEEHAPIVSELCPSEVRYLAVAWGGGRVTAIPEQPEVAENGCGWPSARMVVGETEHPESDSVAAGPESATVIWICSLTVAVIAKVPTLGPLFPSPE